MSSAYCRLSKCTMADRNESFRLRAHQSKIVSCGSSVEVEASENICFLAGHSRRDSESQRYHSDFLEP